MKESEAMRMVIDSKMYRVDGHWYIPQETSRSIVEEVKGNINHIMMYLDGDCFYKQATLLKKSEGIEWVVSIDSTIMQASSHEEVFSGTAAEVDKWCREHKNDKLFSDKYTRKYFVSWREI